eukprot:SAG11_NODE_28899_length_316_cov_1.087558_2_plen_23_part_01
MDMCICESKTKAVLNLAHMDTKK